MKCQICNICNIEFASEAILQIHWQAIHEPMIVNAAARIFGDAYGEVLRDALRRGEKPIAAEIIATAFKEENET